MIDFIGNKFEVGNDVIFMQTKYRNLVRGTVVSESKKMCLIKHDKTFGHNASTETRQYHDQVIKVIKEEE